MSGIQIRKGIDYFDRNPSIIQLGYDNVLIAPHAPTTRWSYTVPANRKAFVQNGFCMLMRDGVAAPAFYATSIIHVSLDGITFNIQGFVIELNNALGITLLNPLADSLLLLSGNTIRFQTQDLSTGGTHAFAASAFIVEFD